jgi:hypothetical protein
VDRIAGGEKDKMPSLDGSPSTSTSSVIDSFPKLDNFDKSVKASLSTASNAMVSASSASSTAAAEGTTAISNDPNAKPSTQSFGDFDMTPMSSSGSGSTMDALQPGSTAPADAKPIDADSTGATLPAHTGPITPKKLPRKPLSNHALSKLFDEELKDLGKM